jgi:hypothetical protein
MTNQWKDELESKFGLSFDIIDRERIGELRRLRGFAVNPRSTGSRFSLCTRLRLTPWPAWLSSNTIRREP